MQTDSAAASNAGSGWQLAITTVAGAGSSVGPSNKKQRTDDQTSTDAAASQKPMGKGKGGKRKQRRPAMDDQVLASVVRLTLQGAQQHRTWEASLLDTFLLPTSSQTAVSMKEAGRAYHQAVQTERIGRPTRRAAPPTRAHLSCRGRITGDADAGHESRTRPAHDCEPAGTVDQLCHAPANGSRSHNSTSIQNQARGGYETSIPSSGRSRSVGTQSWIMHHRRTTHGGHRTAEPSRADLGTSFQRSSGHGNMNQLTRAPTLTTCVLNTRPFADTALLPSPDVANISRRRMRWNTVFLSKQSARPLVSPVGIYSVSGRGDNPTVATQHPGTFFFSAGPPPVHSLPVSVAHDDHVGDTNNGDQSALFPSVAVTRVWDLCMHTCVLIQTKGRRPHWWRSQVKASCF